ncbi:MAG: DNA repair protein RecO [Chloroflexi bacterium]|nr:DNA repair protein RecO [Chloroflexota bacterium]
MSRPERAFRTPLLILKRRDFGEADRLLTVLTPGHGKLSVIAKGARKLASTKTGHVELFTRADALIHRGRDFGIAVQVEQVAPHLLLREDLQRGAYAGYAAELVDRFVLEEGSDDGHAAAVFNLLDATFARLSSATDDPRLVLRYYELHLLDHAGFRPELTECVISHEAIQPEDQFISYGAGGAVRPQAAHRSPTGLVPVSMQTLKLLRHLQRSHYDQVRALQIPPDLHDDAERVLVGYVTFLLERQPDSLTFLRQLRS